MDDSWVAAGSEEEAWRATQRVGYIWKYIGLQYVSRKRRIKWQDGSPWRCTKVHIIDVSFYQLIGEGKCTKSRYIIEKFLQRVTSEEPLYYKELQSDWQFLHHVFDTYKSCWPFLKGMNLALESCHSHQDPEGWEQDPYGLGGDLVDDNLVGEA